MKQFVGKWIVVVCGIPIICRGSQNRLQRTSFLDVAEKFAVSDHLQYKSKQMLYPMPVVSHDKVAGKGYTAESPLYEKQKAWTAINGDNSLEGVGQDDMFKDIPEPYRPIWRMYYEQPYLMITATLLHILLYIILAWVNQKYKKNGFLAPPDESKNLPSKYQGISKCCGWDWQWFSKENKKHDMRILMCAFCCPIIRWADTIDNHKMMDGHFWHAFFLMLILATIGPFTFGVSILVSLCIGIYFRQVLRRKYDRGPGTMKSLMEDIFCWCCCTPCAIAQEAHEIENVSIAHAREDNFKT